MLIYMNVRIITYVYVAMYVYITISLVPPPPPPPPFDIFPDIKTRSNNSSNPTCTKYI